LDCWAGRPTLFEAIRFLPICCDQKLSYIAQVKESLRITPFIYVLINSIHGQIRKNSRCV
jgi:hypothetical protein